MCDNSYPDPYINFLSESPLCTFNFEIKSKHACPVTPGPQIQMCEMYHYCSSFVLFHLYSIYYFLFRSCMFFYCFRNVFLVPHTHDDVGWLMTIDASYLSSLSSHLACFVFYVLPHSPLYQGILRHTSAEHYQHNCCRLRCQPKSYLHLC